MATVITSECINCGACEPECPNTAIYQGGVEWELNGTMHPPIAQDIFYIVADKCSECVGFHDQEACAAVCPVDCCIPDPQNPESEAVLLTRAKALHPDQAFPADFPSRFRKAGAATSTREEITATPTLTPPAPPPPEPKPPAAMPAPAPAAPKPPAAVAALAAAANTAPPPVATAKAAPEPAPAAAKPAAPAVASAAVSAVTPAAAPTPGPAIAAVPKAQAEKKVSPPKPPATLAPSGEIKKKVFPGELPDSFDDAVAQLGSVRPDTPKALKLVAALAQPLLGALPHKQKTAVEAAVGDHRYFTIARATALNVFQNMILYLLIVAAAGAVLLGREVFSEQLNGLIILGVGVVMAGVEAVVRLRKGLQHPLPVERRTYRGTWYAAALAPLLAPLVRKLTPVATHGAVPVDGFQNNAFEDKIERERRYGEVYSLKQQGSGFLLRVEFPRRVPQSATKDQLGIPDEMPDYDYDLSFRNGYFVVKGKVVDKNLRKLAAFSPAFPPDFTTNVELSKPVNAFKHRLHDKTLEVVLLKR
jgi:ferredoxin